ncbi:MAG: type II toxin-antitoxin system VapC family toxin [Bacteroidetes bacterium]|nr:type II toxin-antitoxin system VapC family toxin [Bacteroidota bacterium]
MKNIYLDSSSLIKVYHREFDTDSVLTILSNDIDEIYLSDLTKVEVNSAIWKKIRMGESTENEGKELIKNFESDYAKYEWVKVDLEILNSAKELIKKYGKDGLRTLDSIQLACAVNIKEKVDEYLSSDNKLKELFIKEDLMVI